MLKTKDEKVTGVGVVVARFQVAKLTDGHRDLIESVMARHKQTIILLGCSPVKNTTENPLSFVSRQKMVIDEYPSAIVLPIDDMPDNDMWSANLDSIVSSHASVTSTIVLYGSRDSFIKYYSGKFETKELIPGLTISGTEQRDDIRYTPPTSEDGRSGALYVTQNQYPVCYAAVDIAIYSPELKSFLFGRKPKESKFRFIGGFVDPDTSHGYGSGFLEANAKREAKEETGLDVDVGALLGSFLMDDWRYRSEKSKIHSTLWFAVADDISNAGAADDIAELKWVHIRDLATMDIMDVHTHLLKKLNTYVYGYQFEGEYETV